MDTECQDYLNLLTKRGLSLALEASWILGAHYDWIPHTGARMFPASSGRLPTPTPGSLPPYFDRVIVIVERSSLDCPVAPASSHFLFAIHRQLGLADLPKHLTNSIHRRAPICIALQGNASWETGTSDSLSEEYIANGLLAASYYGGSMSVRSCNDDGGFFGWHTLISQGGVWSRPDLSSDLTKMPPNKAFQK